VPDITIYGIPRSNYVRACCMTALEKGATFDRAHVSFRHLFTDKHRAVHPFLKVPSMRHGDVLVWESTAIMRYLDGTFGEPGVLEPSGFAERIEHEQWLSAVNHSIDLDFVRKYALEYTFPKGPDGTPDKARIDKALPNMRRDLGILDGRLSGGVYLVGGQLTLADILLHNTLDVLNRTDEGAGLLAEAPNVARAMTTIAARPSFQGAAAAAPG